MIPITVLNKKGYTREYILIFVKFKYMTCFVRNIKALRVSLDNKL